MRKLAEEKFKKEVLDSIDFEKIKFNQKVLKNHGNQGYEILNI